MIEATNLTKKFDDILAVDHISAKIREGNVFGLIGTNGAVTWKKKILTVSVYLSETESEVLGELSVSIKDCWKKDRPK